MGFIFAVQLLPFGPLAVPYFASLPLDIFHVCDLAFWHECRLILPVSTPVLESVSPFSKEPGSQK